MPRVKLATGEIRDQIRMALFDTIVQDGSLLGDNKFFQTIEKKTIVDTNMRIQGTLEQGVSFLVQGVGLDAIVYATGLDLVIADVLDHSACVLTIGEKEYLRAPTRHVAGKVRSYNPVIAQYGTHAESCYQLKGVDAITIPSVQTFNLNLRVETSVESASPIRYVGSLKGLMRRPVQ